jgi:hypothetical protein
MDIADVLTADGEWYVDKKGVYYDTVEEYIGSLLQFCGCGDPRGALAYTYAVLRDIDNSTYLHNMSEGVDYFTCYMLTHIGILDHGTSVPGWLTDKGRLVLALLEKVLHNDTTTK